MTDENESLTDAEIAKLARILFGPEEEWNDDVVEFVLKLYGIDTEDTTAYAIKLLSNFVRRKRERGEDVPQPALTMLAKLEQEADKTSRSK
jgi:hypothetical protein